MDNDENIIKFNILNLGKTIEMDMENAIKYMKIVDPSDIEHFIEEGGVAKVTYSHK